MRTGLEAMRLGAVIYFLPFFFVLNPMLTLQNVTAVGLATALATAGGGIFLISCGLQGYIIGIGPMGDSPLSWAPRVLLVAGGVFIGWPGNLTTVIGLTVAVPLLLGYLALNRRSRESAQRGSGLAQK